VSRIHIVGSGQVGAATGRALARAGHPVTFVDADPERVAALCTEGLDARPVLDLAGEPEGFVFACLPTAVAGRPGYDLGALTAGVERIGAALAGADTRPTVLVRSSTPPGTTDGLVGPLLARCSGRREGAGFCLAAVPDLGGRTVVGARDPRVAARVARLLESLGDPVRVFGDPAAAELVTCAHSALDATRISFWNEIWQICERLGIDQDAVAEAVTGPAGAGERFGARGGAPYAGARLPRDTHGLLGLARELGLPMPLLSAVVGVNEHFAERLAAELEDLSLLAAIPSFSPEPRGVEPQRAEVFDRLGELPLPRRRPGPRIPRQQGR
jgi:UDPglucose 6-dehydrogenase